MITDYPKIKVADALKKTSGNQAELGRELGYKRAYINEIISTHKFLPETAAWRFVRRYGEQSAA